MQLYLFPYILGLPPPSLIWQYEDKIGFLGQDIVVISPVLPGKITWYVFVKDHNDTVKSHQMAIFSEGMKNLMFILGGKTTTGF